METQRVCLLVCNLFILLSMVAAVFVMFNNTQSTCSSADINVAVRTPQTVRYITPSPIDHVYEENIVASNVSAANPIIISMRKGDQTVFLVRMTLENPTKGGDVNMWIS